MCLLCCDLLNDMLPDLVVITRLLKHRNGFVLLTLVCSKKPPVPRCQTGDVRDVNSEQVVFCNSKRSFLKVSFSANLLILSTIRSNFPTHTFGKENAFPVLVEIRFFPPLPG